MALIIEIKDFKCFEIRNLRTPPEMPRLKGKLTTKVGQKRAAVIQVAVKAVHIGQSVRNTATKACLDYSAKPSNLI